MFSLFVFIVAVSQRHQCNFKNIKYFSDAHKTVATQEQRIFHLEIKAIKLTSVSASNYCHDIDHHHKNTIKTMVFSLYTCYF